MLWPWFLSKVALTISSLSQFGSGGWRGDMLVGFTGVARQLFPCRWVELNLEMLARRPGQAPAPGSFWVKFLALRGHFCLWIYMDLGVVVVAAAGGGRVDLGCSALGFAIDKHGFPNPVGSMRVPISCHAHGSQQKRESHFFPFLFRIFRRTFRS